MLDGRATATAFDDHLAHIDAVVARLHVCLMRERTPMSRVARCCATNRRSGLRWCWSNRFLMPFTSSTGVTVPTAFVVEQNVFHALNLPRRGDLMFS